MKIRFLKHPGIYKIEEKRRAKCEFDGIAVVFSNINSDLTLEKCMSSSGITAYRTNFLCIKEKVGIK